MILSPGCWEQDRPPQKPLHDGPGSCASARLECSLAGFEDGPSRAPNPHGMQRLHPKGPVSWLWHAEGREMMGLASRWR